MDSDRFSSVGHHIIGQQISTKAQQTIWQRMNDVLGEVSPETIGKAPAKERQSFGMTFRKVEYIRAFSRKILSGEFDLNAVEHMSDEDAISAHPARHADGLSSQKD